MKNKWQAYMRDSERAEIEAISSAHKWSGEAKKLMIRKIKSRCESRMRAEKEKGE